MFFLSDNAIFENHAKSQFIFLKTKLVMAIPFLQEWKGFITVYELHFQVVHYKLMPEH